MSDQDTQARSEKAVNDWFAHLISGWSGKLFLLAFIPVSSFLFGQASNYVEKDKAALAKIDQKLGELIEQQRTLSYRQQEVLRHVVVLERRVFGHSTLPPAVEYGGLPDAYETPIPYPGSGTPPAPPPPKPDGDKRSLLDPSSRRNFEKALARGAL